MKKDEIHQFTKGSYFLFHFRGVGLVLVLYNFYAIIQELSLLSVLLILLGTALFFSKEKYELDFEFMQYREAFSLSNISFGKWHNLPEIDYVSIFPTKLTQTIQSAQTAHATSRSFKEVRINLVHGKNQRMHIFRSKDVAELRKKAMFFADKLNVGVYDCTGEENVWLKERNS